MARKKRHEILQMELLNPEDRDPGRDRLRPRYRRSEGRLEGINRFRQEPGHGVLLIVRTTPEILQYVQPGLRARVRRTAGLSWARAALSWPRSWKRRSYEKLLNAGRGSHDHHSHPPPPALSRPPAWLDVSGIRADFLILGPQACAAASRWSTSTPGPTSARSRARPARRRDATSTRSAQLGGVHRAALICSARRPPTAYEARPGLAAARFIGAAGAGRDRVHQRASTEAHEPGRVRDEQRGHRSGPQAAGRFRGGPRRRDSWSPSLEHHANLVPWQHAVRAHRRHAALVRRDPGWPGGPQSDAGHADQRTGPGSSRSRTSPTSLGAVPPVRRDRCHGARSPGAAVVVADGAPVGAAPSWSTSHARRRLPRASPRYKMPGPSGIGVLWGRRELLEAMPPFMGSRRVDDRGGPDGRPDVPAPPPERVRGLRHIQRPPRPPDWLAACDYLDAARTWRTSRAARTRTSSPRTRWRVTSAPSMRTCASSARHRRPVGRGCAISFTIDGVHLHDVGQLLDELGIAVRADHHCCLSTAPRPRGAGQRAGDVLRVQHPRRGRGAGRGRAPDTAQVFRGGNMMQRHRGSAGTSRPRHRVGGGVMEVVSRCTRRSSWITTATRTTRACGSRSTPRLIT